MPSFRDNQDRRYTIDLTIGSAKRVRDTVGVNLLRILDEPQMLADLSGDPIQFVDMLYVLVQPQVKEYGLTDEQFGESLAGDSIEAATNAFLEALVAFFPPARRAALRKILDRATDHLARQESELKRIVDDGTLDRAIDEAMGTQKPKRTTGKKSGKSPAVPASNPAA